MLACSAVDELIGCAALHLRKMIVTWEDFFQIGRSIWPDAETSIPPQWHCQLDGLRSSPKPSIEIQQREFPRGIILLMQLLFARELDFVSFWNTIQYYWCYWIFKNLKCTFLFLSSAVLAFPKAPHFLLRQHRLKHGAIFSYFLSFSSFVFFSGPY